MALKLRQRSRSSGAPPEVAEGVYRLGTRWINFYLVAEQREFTVIDAGYPGYWKQFVAAIEALDTTPEAVRAVILTHHHADHAGIAERLRSAAGARVLAGEGDSWIVGGRYPSHANPGFYRDCWWRPSGIAFLAHSAIQGGAKYRPVRDLESLEGDRALDLPGRPQVIGTRGHTAGHHAVALPERGVLFSGDAMANFDYAIGTAGLGLHRFNDDRELALASLDRLDAVDAEVVLFGHGDPWKGPLDRALQIIRERAGPR
jgi:glyoxylase-like metal-dependent hydrolase (beta-lactamase superfamily II)